MPSLDLDSAPPGDPGSDTPVFEMTITLPRGASRDRLTLPTLRVLAGPDITRFITLAAGQTITVGRGRECDLRVDDPSVSRQHARVTCQVGGRIEISDLGSTNGMTVNGHRAAVAELRFGDIVDLGNVPLRLDRLGADEIAHLERVRRKLAAADCDPLTGLKSRACLNDELPGLLARAEAAGSPVSAIFLDLDWFKSVNDRFGHSTGDAVLRDVGRIVMMDMRDSDLCTRYGGEEILVVLPGTPLEAAEAIANRLRTAIADHPWDRVAEGLAVTASFGVGERKPDEPLLAWLDRTDRALYAAKSQGRNRIVRATRH